MSQDKENYEAYNIGEEPDGNTEPEEDYYEEETYDALGSDDEANPYLQFLKSNAILLALIGVIIIVLVVLYQRLPKAPFETIPDSQLTDLEQRIVQLEEKLGQTETLQTQLDGIVLPEQQVELLNKRVGEMEAFVSKQLEILSGRLDTLEKAPPKSAKSTSQPAKKTAAKKSPTATTSAKYHTVKSGETLFSIANKYNVSIDELKRMNKMSASTIHPGDKLRVSQ